MTTCPHTEPLMAMAWRDCLIWSVQEPEIVATFRKETGCNFEPPGDPIGAMIDQATGYGAAGAEDFCVRYIEWFNREIWGPVP